MTSRTFWTWEQDGAGGEHGTATFFPRERYETTVPLPSFKVAHQLARAIEADLHYERLEGRRALLAEINRIEP